ncbi:hypothetical protein FNB79_10200 [Formosa sediminum]|uniref:EF-hand domain-containing protein n=2 Tax=Formosa sediminum TaxID=2594004 RepID=A0A516GW26_9FLAO|nr:hypothetical protein FNB79_10200 [Formosa sediminum]
MFACQSKKDKKTDIKEQNVTEQHESERPLEGNGSKRHVDGPPSFNKLLEEMDANADGKLSKDEVKGPLESDFDKIDTDKDGFISKTELENGPKPQRGDHDGQRPPKEH